MKSPHTWQDIWTGSWLQVVWIELSRSPMYSEWDNLPEGTPLITISKQFAPKDNSQIMQSKHKRSWQNIHHSWPSPATSRPMGALHMQKSTTRPTSGEATTIEFIKCRAGIIHPHLLQRFSYGTYANFSVVGGQHSLFILWRCPSHQFIVNQYLHPVSSASVYWSKCVHLDHCPLTLRDQEERTERGWEEIKSKSVAISIKSGNIIETRLINSCGYYCWTFSPSLLTLEALLYLMARTLFLRRATFDPPHGQHDMITSNLGK